MAEHPPQRHVLEHREMPEGPGNLVGARDAKARDAMGAPALRVRAGQADLPGIGAIVARDDVDQRRLVEAVRPDEAEEPAPSYLEPDARKRLRAGKGLAHARRGQQRPEILNWPMAMREFK